MGLFKILLGAIRIDFASVCALYALPLLAVTIGSLLPKVRLGLWFVRVLQVYCAAAVSFLVMNEAATPSFIMEYGVRPNHLYVQYLRYPREVISMLWQGHKLSLILGVILTVVTFVLSYRIAAWAFQGRKQAVAVEVQQQIGTLSKIKADRNSNSNSESEEQLSLFHSLGQKSGGGYCDDVNSLYVRPLPSGYGYRQGSKLYSLVMLLLVLVIVPLGIRSTLGHRPLNPSMVAFCNNSLVNSLPSNSSYNAVYALAHLNDNEVSSDMIYAKVSADQALGSIGAYSQRIEPAVYDEQCPLNQVVVPWTELWQQSPVTSGMSALHQEALASAQAANPEATIVPPRNYNIVIILEESLGDNFVASQGGWPLTPNLDKLRQQGWYFDNMLAAGHRSIRGIEAVTASMPPSPLQSIVDLPFASDPYATIFAICEMANYATSFIYGGESHFDNMRGYFLNNGMKKVIEQKDYQNPSFVASWGVSDEDLFMRANEEFKQRYSQGEPFCSVVFSSSFHDPFDIPAGKVDLEGIDLESLRQNAKDDYEVSPQRLLAAKYADYALGRFFEVAKKEDYFKDTIFLVIADHESRVSGAGAFPFSDFTIPAVILAPNVGPYIDQRVVSQVDMGMTLLSLAGFSGEVPNVGQNLLQPQIRERASMQFNNLFGYYDATAQRFVQLVPHQEPVLYDVKDAREISNPQPVKTDAEQQLVSQAVNFENLGLVMYQKQLISRNCVKLDPQFTPLNKATLH